MNTPPRIALPFPAPTTCTVITQNTKKRLPFHPPLPQLYSTHLRHSQKTGCLFCTSVPSAPVLTRRRDPDPHIPSPHEYPAVPGSHGMLSTRPHFTSRPPMSPLLHYSRTRSRSPRFDPAPDTRPSPPPQVSHLA
ncbi:hypothetical protein HYPSUDRAFT_209471 [Hypholoma sublateritium FD-334 SS-4]|uniref:Uncharacterized protein n=1 Tax=Hypholoma sublateritium (strain FD-334 SS-4) TaxID=945553 RepID=A0A0D2KG73_HYPSF|nr:hypothetical protein HYPSUDRAFT_209471 [Hypholoma sublateritium FD-334 SS-4]